MSKMCNFPLKFLNFLASGSAIRIRNTDPDTYPDPQPWYQLQIPVPVSLKKFTYRISTGYK
jgi:hypothetical protein